MGAMVSVIIPFFNRIDWLDEAIESVLQQSYKDFEIILINDGSKEDLSSILLKYKDKIIYQIKENGGPGSARNLGIEIAKGDFIAFLDSDDIWSSDKLEKQVRFMKKNKYVWSHTGYQVFSDKTKNIIKAVNVKSYKEDIFPLVIISCPIATPSIMIQSEILKRDKDLRFSNASRYGEDSALWLKLSLLYPIGVLNENLCWVRNRGSNAALNARIQIKGRAQILDLLISQNVNMKKNKLIRQTIFFFKINKHADNLLELLENRKVGILLIEYLAKIIYTPIWISFKYLKYRSFAVGRGESENY
jgi:teichuronic acid biosynthesis glycosyltransferase TuaG